jgi:ABC-type multidrug transport system fused ATPase/permease subunit
LRKSVSCDSEARHETPPGQIASLVSADLTRLELAFQYTVIAVGFPLSLIIGVVLLLVNQSVSALAGIGVFFLILAVMSFPPKLMFDYRIKANVFTDKRVSLICETLQNMKMIKFYSWEDAYEALLF